MNMSDTQFLFQHDLNNMDNETVIKEKEQIINRLTNLHLYFYNEDQALLKSKEQYLDILKNRLGEQYNK